MEHRASFQTNCSRHLKGRLIVAFVISCALVFPLSARADAGTPLMWAGIFHLFVGNAIIGVFEGLLISWFFSVRKLKTMALMVPANYFSAWIGVYFMDGVVLPVNLNTFWLWFWAMVFVTYCMTLLLEWPFVAFCFWRNQKWLGTSIKASLVVQTASYVLLFGWYAVNSNLELFSSLKVVQPSELSLPEHESIYFISASNGNVYRQTLKNGTPQKIYDLHSTNQWDCLFAQRNAINTNHWDLLARMQTGDARDPRIVEIAKGIPVKEAAVLLDHNDIYLGQQIGNITNASWIISPHWGWYEWIDCYNASSRRRIRLGCETPFCAWWSTNPVCLSSSVVLFQLGLDQICAFSPDQRKIALLWRGYGAVPVIDRE